MRWFGKNVEQERRRYEGAAQGSEYRGLECQPLAADLLKEPRVGLDFVRTDRPAERPRQEFRENPSRGVAVAHARAGPGNEEPGPRFEFLRRHVYNVGSRFEVLFG